MAQGKKKGYKKLLVGKEKIPAANKYDKALSGSGGKKRELKKLGNLNEEASEDLILSINYIYNKRRQCGVQYYNEL